MPLRMFSSNLELYLLDASSNFPVVTTKDFSSHCQIEGGENVQNHSN